MDHAAAAFSRNGKLLAICLANAVSFNYKLQIHLHELLFLQGLVLSHVHSTHGPDSHLDHSFPGYLGLDRRDKHIGINGKVFRAIGFQETLLSSKALPALANIGHAGPRGFCSRTKGNKHATTPNTGNIKLSTTA